MCHFFQYPDVHKSIQNTCSEVKHSKLQSEKIAPQEDSMDQKTIRRRQHQGLRECQKLWGACPPPDFWHSLKPWCCLLWIFGFHAVFLRCYLLQFDVKYGGIYGAMFGGIYNPGFQYILRFFWKFDGSFFQKFVIKLIRSSVLPSDRASKLV